MTNEQIQRLEELEAAEELRRIRACAAARKWREAHPDAQKNRRAAMKAELAELRAERAAEVAP